jgi:hypothetical protein
MNNKIQSLGDKLVIEIKVLGTTMNARFATMDTRFETSNAKMQSKFDRLRIELKDREARFWLRVVFTVSGLLCICYILSSNNAKVLAVAGVTFSATFLQYQNRAIQTPAVQTPAVQVHLTGGYALYQCLPLTCPSTRLFSPLKIRPSINLCSPGSCG